MPDSEKLSLDDLISEYPVLEGWFDNQTNKTAQIYGDRRVMSASEKIALFGGVNQIKSNLSAVTRGWRDHYLYLLACRQEPMVVPEVDSFAGSLGRRLLPTTIAVNLKQLSDTGEIKLIPELIYVRRHSDNPYQFRIIARPGYLTTDQGTRAIALNLSQKESRSFLGRLKPEPKAD